MSMIDAVEEYMERYDSNKYLFKDYSNHIVVFEKFEKSVFEDGVCSECEIVDIVGLENVYDKKEYMMNSNRYNPYKKFVIGATMTNISELCDSYVNIISNSVRLMFEYNISICTDFTFGNYMLSNAKINDYVQFPKLRIYVTYDIGEINRKFDQYFDGELVNTFELVNGKIHGRVRKYYGKKLKFDAEYVNGVAHGKYYVDMPCLKITGNMNMDVFSGKINFQGGYDGDWGEYIIEDNHIKSMRQLELYDVCHFV